MSVPARRRPALPEVSTYRVDISQAEVLAKAGLLRGTGRCFDLIDDRIDVAMVVDRRGLVSTSANFTNFVSGQLPAALPEPNTSNDWSRT